MNHLLRGKSREIEYVDVRLLTQLEGKRCGDNRMQRNFTRQVVNNNFPRWWYPGDSASRSIAGQS
jgi:hypothetical protein